MIFGGLIGGEGVVGLDVFFQWWIFDIVICIVIKVSVGIGVGVVGIIDCIGRIDMIMIYLVFVKVLLVGE